MFMSTGFNPSEIVEVLPKDAIPAIYKPCFEDAREIVGMTPREEVIGLSIGDDSRAYPTAILSSHEIVNDVVGGQPVVITW